MVIFSDLVADTPLDIVCEIELDREPPPPTLRMSLKAFSNWKLKINYSTILRIFVLFTVAEISAPNVMVVELPLVFVIPCS